MSDIPDWAFEEADKLFDPVTTPASSKHVREIIARAFVAERERCAKIAEKAFGGPAHTYASENADIYHAQDSACAHIAALIRKPANSNFKSIPHGGPVS